jgi:two-component system NtrC family sensor kinase
MISLDQRLVILLLTTCANLVLGLAVWRKNPSQQVNQRFALYSLSVAAWTLSNGLVNTYAATPHGVVWARAAFASASAIPLSFFLFVSVFPTPRPSPSAVLSRVFLISALVIIGLSPTPLIALSTSSLNGVLRVAYGPIHPLFAAYFITGLVYSLVFLYRKLRVLTGMERLQVRYVFLGIFLPILGGTATNLIVPLVFNSSQFSQFGPLFSILGISLIAHAIVRYRLMNIHLVIRRGVVYLLAIAVVSTVFLALLSLGSRILVSRPHELPVWLEPLLVVVLAIVFNPIKSSVQRWVDRYFFRESYDYRRAVREISIQMAAILDLQSLLEFACDAVSKTVKPEYVAAYAKDSSGRSYTRLVLQRYIQIGEATAPEKISADSLIPAYLEASKHPILTDDLPHSGGGASWDLKEVREELRHLGVAIAVPIHEHHSLSGFFLVGPKLSGDALLSDDMDLLAILLSQVTIAMKNAQLYSEVVLANDYVENILSTIDSAVIAVDGRGTVTRFNSAAERLTGLFTMQMKGKSFHDLPRSISRLIEATSTDSQPRTQIETTLRDAATHRVVPVICSTSPLLDRAGLVLGAVAIISDLTSLKRLEEEKRQVERLASIGALAAGIAHEIKNPLVAIKTFAELLPERFEEHDFRNEFSRVAIKEIERIDDLVARLRGLAISSQQTLTPLDLRTPIEETLALLRGQLEQARISLKVEFEEHLPLVAGSFAQLKQLFLNLLVNAVEATEPGGNLSIRVQSHPRPEGRTVAVDVVDSGSGIPEHLLGRVFVPFVTTKPQGTGLGLSICRGITDVHRATIQAQNNSPGPGVTVTVEFPSSTDIPAAITH